MADKPLIGRLLSVESETPGTSRTFWVGLIGAVVAIAVPFVGKWTGKELDAELITQSILGFLASIGLIAAADRATKVAKGKL